MKLYAPSTIAAIKEKHNFKLSKSLGQNFLTDQNIIEKIIEQSHIGESDLVIEIGPGIGVLTAAAAEQALRVVAVEIDRNLIPILQETLKEYDNIQIVHQDILKTDLAALVEQNREIAGQKTGAVRVIGNLPYYITTPILMKILEERAPVDSITVMMQKEVADRIKAGPGTKTYGALSVAVQYYSEVVHVANVPKEVFMPRPKVDSTVLRLDLRGEPPVELHSEKVFFACVKAGFGQRRKTLLNSLTGVLGLPREAVAAALHAAGIQSERRAETLQMNEFAMLANQIYEEHLTNGENQTVLL